MEKYAFIENVPGLSVGNYMKTFDDGEWSNHIAGFDGMDKVIEYAKKLVAEGYSLINLCGDFGPDEVAEILKDAPEGTEAHYAAYLPSEVEKLEQLDAQGPFLEYGQIIFGGVEEPLRFDLEAPELNTHTVFVKDFDQALQVAQDFARSNIQDIELCSGFDLDMTKQIIAAVEAINPSLPVGSNGFTV